MRRNDEGFLGRAARLGFEAVAQGLGTRPVTGPVKATTVVWIFAVFIGILIGAVLTIALSTSPTLSQIATWVAVVSFGLTCAALLLQVERSRLWNQSLLTGGNQARVTQDCGKPPSR
ncbi:MAG: hypothetical protein ABFD86_06810 [Bryobacteraceae bacterium]